MIVETGKSKTHRTVQREETKGGVSIVALSRKEAWSRIL